MRASRIPWLAIFVLVGVVLIGLNVCFVCMQKPTLEGFVAEKTGALPIGPWDGLFLQGVEQSYWRDAPAEPGAANGHPDAEQPLAMFAKNECKPECCPAGFSCSSGCVCATPEQLRLIHSRGGNAT